MAEHQEEGPAAALPHPLGNYARWRRAGGLIFVAGVSARLPSGAIEGVNDVTAQTHRVLHNIAAILQEAGANLADCVDMSCYLVRPEDFAAFNAAYAQHFPSASDNNGSSPPTRTTVVVRALPHPDMLVEIKAVASALASASGP